MQMKQVQFFRARHFHHRRGQGHPVGMLGQQGMIERKHLVIADVWAPGEKPRRRLVAKEEHPVPAPAEGHPHFGGHHAASPKGGEAHHPDTQPRARSHHGSRSQTSVANASVVPNLPSTNRFSSIAPTRPANDGQP